MLSEIVSENQQWIDRDLSIIDELEKRFENLKTKTEVIQALETPSLLGLINSIPLTMQNVTVEQAQKDFRRERILFNDVPFIPDKVDENRCHAFSITLKLLIERLMKNRDCYDSMLFESSDIVSDTVMQRACRTSAGADSFFMVQKLLCKEGTFVTQQTDIADSPIRLDLFITESQQVGDVGGCLCSRVEVKNRFAIYDLAVIDEITGNEIDDPPAWLEIEAVVLDESNFKTREHWRILELVITNPLTQKVYNPETAVSKNIYDRFGGKLVISEIASWFTTSVTPGSPGVRRPSSSGHNSNNAYSSIPTLSKWGLPISHNRHLKSESKRDSDDSSITVSSMWLNGEQSNNISNLIEQQKMSPDKPNRPDQLRTDGLKNP
eukprot:gene15973-21679_t